MRYFSSLTTIRRTALSAVSLAALSTSWAYATPAATDSAAADYIEDISVVATRSERPVFQLPASVSVVDEEQIKDLVASTTTDLFDNIPSVQFTGGPRRTGEVPSIRGQSGGGVLVLYDGVRQNFLSGHDGRFFIDPSLLKTAEVVRGPASSLYGSGALGGVIAFSTIEARDRLKEDQTLGYQLRGGFQGVNNEWLAGATLFGRSEDDRIDGVASMTWRTSGDIDLANGASLQADDELASGLLKARIKVSDSLTLSGTWTAFRGDALEPNNGQNLNLGDLVNKDITSDTLRFGADYKPVGQDLIDLGLIAYWNQTGVQEAEIDSDRVIDRSVETTGFILDNRSRFELSDGFVAAVTIGADYYEDRQAGTDSSTTDGTRGGVPNGAAQTLGLFAQLELDIETDFGTFLIIPSLRYDSFQNRSADLSIETDADAWNPRIAASWQPVEWLTLFSAFGESFRAPSYNEIFTNGVHFQIPLGPFVLAPNFFVPNPDLKPENAQTWEFGGGVDFADLLTGDDRFTVKATYHTSDITNLIDLGVDMAFSPGCFSPVAGPCTSGTSRNINQDKGTIKGFELEASYDSPRFFLNTAYSTITGRNQDDEFLGILTPDRTNFIGGVKVPEADMRIGARAEIAGRLNAVPVAGNERAGYSLIDLYAVWQPQDGPLKGLRLDLGIDNLFDANAERIFAGVPEPGQNVKVAFSWTQGF